MTFSVFFHAEQALLWSVRYALKTWPDPDKNPSAFLATGSSCILSCAAALEAIVNSILRDHSFLRHWDELRLVSKIDTIADLSSENIEWGEQPWQDIARLVRIRNWLAHHKDPYVGLSGADDTWIEDDLNQRPKIDPEEALSEVSIRQLYNAVREAGLILGGYADVSGSYAYLQTEDYWPLVS